MKGLVVSPAAQADLVGIWNYTAEHWSEEQADLYIRAINDAFLEISTERKAGRPVPEIRAGYYKLAVGSHFISTGLVTAGAFRSSGSCISAWTFPSACDDPKRSGSRIHD